MDIEALVATVGAPTAIVFMLLWRIDRRLGDLNRTLLGLMREQSILLEHLRLQGRRHDA